MKLGKEGTNIRVTPHFSETVRAKSDWGEIFFQVWKEKTITT